MYWNDPEVVKYIKNIYSYKSNNLQEKGGTLQTLHN